MNNREVAEAFYRGDRIAKGSHFYVSGDALYSYGDHFIVAVRMPDGSFILNGETYSNTTSKHQSIARHVLGDRVIIPFRALREINAVTVEDIRHIQIIDVTSSTTREVPYTDVKTGERKIRTEHLLGSVLFRYEGNNYLSSTDASAKSFRQGYFLVQLPEPVETVEQAYDCLRPKELSAQSSFVRQGEFFFIPTNKKTSDLKGVLENKNLAEVLGNPQGNPHEAREIRTDGQRFYARGSVRHPEHKMVSLGSAWHEVFINRAVNSWSGFGMVD